MSVNCVHENTWEPDYSCIYMLWFSLLSESVHKTCVFMKGIWVIQSESHNLHTCAYTKWQSLRTHMCVIQSDGHNAHTHTHGLPVWYSRYTGVASQVQHPIEIAYPTDRHRDRHVCLHYSCTVAHIRDAYSAGQCINAYSCMPPIYIRNTLYCESVAQCWNILNRPLKKIVSLFNS